MTPSALEAHRILRDGSLLQWYVIPLFALVAFRVFDINSLRRKIKIVGAIYTFDIICLVLFAGVLKWI